MAVNGIELAVGQKWRTRGGYVMELIKREDNGSRHPWIARDNNGDPEGYTDNGKYNAFDVESSCDLVQLVPQMPVADDDIYARAFHALPVIEQQAEVDPRFAAAHYGHDLHQDPQDAKRAAHAFAGAAGVGDINSDAKGSGARFNAGKPPYELIPLRLMEMTYRSAILSPSDGQTCALKALRHLAMFQERTTGALLKAMLAMGPGGWTDCANVFDYGKRKYLAWNWSKGMAWSIPIACAARHLEAIIRGEVNDPESGLPHRGHAMCNFVMLATYEQTYLEGDDRAPLGCLAPAWVAANDQSTQATA